MVEIYDRYTEYLQGTLDEADYKTLSEPLIEIRNTIEEYNITDKDVEFMYNIVDTIDRLFFLEESDENAEGQLERSIQKVKDYIISGTLYSTTNPFQDKGYLLIRKEEESFKLGTKGTRGITTCGVCKMDNIIIYSAQKRGMDEGETIFNTCVDCGHKWVIR